MPTTVKFLHPGGEWYDTADEGIAYWLQTHYDHTRRYIQARGRYLTELDRPAAEGTVGFWGEYEATTSFRRLTRQPYGGYPEFVHVPVPQDELIRPVGVHTSDPLVLGSHWLYSNCRQQDLHSLRRLRPGDVLIFGSRVLGTFVVDTVFVVAEAIRYESPGVRRFVGTQVPEHAYTLSLDLVGPGAYTLYIGATYDKRVNGMFSFVPAAPVAGHPIGFPRPPGPRSLQNGQTMGIDSRDDPGGYWLAAAATVLAHGLCLGVDLELP